MGAGFLASAVSLPLKYVWFLSDSYDMGPSTKINPFDLGATFYYDRDLHASCITSDCTSADHYVLTYRAEKPIQVVSYNVCGGLYCIRQNDLASYGKEGTTSHPVWGDNITVASAPWKINDTVDIRLKVQPVGITSRGIFPEPENMMFIDLGESKIRECQ